MADNSPVKVITSVKGIKNALFSFVRTNLLKQGRAKVSFRFSYPSGQHADDGNDWNSPEKHSTKILSADKNSVLIERNLDCTSYYVLIQWEGDAVLDQIDDHMLILSTHDDYLSFQAEFADKVINKDDDSYSFDKSLKGVMKYWPAFWKSGGITDFSGCTDPRAKELERRVVLSQYLTKINCDNSTPPQETGLTYNSWYGRPHLEMTWWHAVDFSLWNHPTMVENMLSWYNTVAYPEAKKIAERQGFKGVRWMKMTDPEAGEAPSNTGSFLTWQQPHYIYLAEEIYRYYPDNMTLVKYGEGVEETAEFMADFAKACAPAQGLIELWGQTAMQETMSKDFSFGHPFEQAYWWYGLTIAQKWRERRGLDRRADWDSIISRLAPLKEEDGIYTAGIPVKPFTDSNEFKEFDPYLTSDLWGKKEISKEDFLLKSKSDHPAVLGACGLLPKSPVYNYAVMDKTLTWVIENWNWESTWGWDYGMAAMAAARLHRPENAVELLLIDKGKNTYLGNGHNFQEPKRLRLYMPGNGALLTAVAMMCAGWDGCIDIFNPGFPKNGKWNVRWENLHRMQ